MSKDIDWKVYEARKAEIQKENLSPEKYERAIRELVEELDSESDELES